MTRAVLVGRLRRTDSFVVAKAQVPVQFPNQSLLHQSFDQVLDFVIELPHQRLTDRMLEALSPDAFQTGGQGFPGGSGHLAGWGQVTQFSQ